MTPQCYVGFMDRPFAGSEMPLHRFHVQMAQAETWTHLRWPLLGSFCGCFWQGHSYARVSLLLPRVKGNDDRANMQLCPGLLLLLPAGLPLTPHCLWNEILCKQSTNHCAQSPNFCPHARSALRSGEVAEHNIRHVLPEASIHADEVDTICKRSGRPPCLSSRLINLTNASTGLQKDMPHCQKSQMRSLHEERGDL